MKFRINKSKPKKIWTCPKCGSEITKLPLTDYIENGKAWHIPHFGKARCNKCGWESELYGRGLVQTKYSATSTLKAK